MYGPYGGRFRLSAKRHPQITTFDSQAVALYRLFACSEEISAELVA